MQLAVLHQTVVPRSSATAASRHSAQALLFRLDNPLTSAACCGAAGPLPIMAYPQDKGAKLCLDAAATVHKVLIRIPKTNPFQYKYTDFQPKMYLRAKSQTLLVVRFSRCFHTVVLTIHICGTTCSNPLQ